MQYQDLIEKMAFRKLTPIQIATFNKFNNKKHLVGVAPTGTGKTHAYLIPLVGEITFDVMKLQAIIVVPTNELVNQVKLMIEPLLDEKVKLKVYDSKVDKKREYAWLEKYQPHIVIATPDKVIDFSNHGLNIGSTKYFILDEADMMFDEAFLSQIDNIINRINNAKYLLFSATINESMYTFIKKYFGAYDLIDTSNEHELKIEQRLIKSGLDNRDDIFLKVVNSLNPYLAIVFVSKKDNQDAVYNLLSDQGLKVGLLSAKLNQHQRKNMIKDIHDLKYQYIVASDLASRGLDFDCSHVINYDLPRDLEFFRHRSGRTGRMEKDGIVITIVNNNDRNKVRKLEELGNKFIEYKFEKGLMVTDKKEKSNIVSDEEMEKIKKIPKPKKVKPNYRKKNREKISKVKKEVRSKNYAKNR